MLDIDHHLTVAGTGSFVPERIVDNATLEGMVTGFRQEEGGDPFGVWVDRVTHIHERRYLDFDGSSGDMAREACRKAIDDSGVDPADIDLFLMATFTTKNIYPGEQTMLVEEFGMKGGNAATFYLTAGCAGSVYALHTATAFLRAGIYRNALVVGTEHLAHVINFDDPVTAILFGDGAGAVMLSRRDEPGPGGLSRHCVLGSSYAPGSIVMDNANVPRRDQLHMIEGGEGYGSIATDRHYVSMTSGPRVLRTAVNAMADATVRSLGFTMADLKQKNPELRELLDRAKIVPHQANGRIIDGLRDKLRVRDEQVYKTIYRYGNISCASNTITLDYAVRRGNMKRVVGENGDCHIEDDVGPKIEPGDLVAVPTVGAGYLTGCFTYVAE